MKIIWKGNVFNPTGIATANRELIKALSKKGVIIQSSDIWNSSFSCNKGLEYLNQPIDSKKTDITVFADYPQFWREGYGKVVGFFLHEGTVLHPGWAEIMNMVDLILVPSRATYNLFRANEVKTDIKIVPYGVNPDYYNCNGNPIKDDNFIFLSVNSWTGRKGDRKGTDILLKAFDEEFKPDEKVKLLLKIGTFWQTKPEPRFYEKSVFDILGHINPNILINDEYKDEEELSSYYKQSDCFVVPTRGEAFGLTIINAMACGLPVIVTKDNNSGYMDFCRGRDSVLFIDVDSLEQGDRQFYAEGNLQPVPSLESLKKQMRYAFEHREELLEKGKNNAKDILTNWNWDKSADKFLEAVK